MATMKTLNGYGFNATELNGKTSDSYLQKTDTASDTSKLGGKAPEYYLQPRNLLDNSDFTKPVNQREKTSYTGSIYSIDRWSSFYSACVVNVNDGYILIKNGSINQYVPVPNGVYSAFACNIDGDIIELDISYSTSKDMMNVSIPAGEWLWACMYEGSYTADTLPPYVPKGYAAELAECKRYFEMFYFTSVFSRTNYIGNLVYCAVNFVAKRVNPTISIKEISSPGTYGQSQLGTLTIGDKTSTCVLIQSTLTDAAGKCAWGRLEVSADL